MSIHLCRDFPTHLSASTPGTNMYALSIFMTHVLGFEIAGSTNFPLNSSSYLLASSGIDQGSYCSLNQGAGAENVIQFPTASYLISNSDIGRIVALKSSDNPTKNSGLFRITSASISSNELEIDYRSPDLPPSENLAWKIFESELNVSNTWSSGSNSSVGYNSNKTADSSRILLRSTLGTNLDWSVRLCLESNIDIASSSQVGMSIAPGWIGDVSSIEHDRGDFTSTDFHLHGPMWFDTTSSLYKGSVVGTGVLIDKNWSTGNWNINIIGDDLSGTTLMLLNSSSLSGANDSLVIFGLPDNEPNYLGPDSVQDTSENNARRLFSFGNTSGSLNLTWNQGFQNEGLPQGMSWGTQNSPIPLVVSNYASIRNESNPIRDSSNCSDGVFVNATELLDIQLIAGTIDVTQKYDDNLIYDIEPRILGTLPFLRHGRSNFQSWALTSDVSSSWLHTSGGIYVTWKGPSLQTQLSGSDFIDLSELIISSGLQFDEYNSQASDPETEQDLSMTERDIDATRYRKTYSFFRQEPRNLMINI